MQDKEQNPIIHDKSKMHLFALLRYLHYEYDLKNNIGDEQSLKEHTLRFGQDATLAFQERQIHRIIYNERRTKIQIQSFGLLGPNGALPIHITEAIYEKILHEKDNTFNDFLDIFHHRLIGLFYKSWLMSQPIVQLENLKNHSFNNYISGFVGNNFQADDFDINITSFRQFYYSSLLLNQNMPIDNLKELLRNFFGIPIAIKQNIGQWINAEEHSTILSHQSIMKLGEGILIGTRYYDATSKFRILIGPVNVATYLRFLKNGELAKQLNYWVIRYTKHSYVFDVEIIVQKDDVSPLNANHTGRLGQNSWQRVWLRWIVYYRLIR